MNEYRGAHLTIGSFRLYLNCAAIAMFLLSSLILIGAYSSNPWVSLSIAQSLGESSDLVLTAPLVGSLLISGLQLSSKPFCQTIPTGMDMALFCVLQVATFLIAYLAFSFFRTFIDSILAMLIITPIFIFLPPVCFIQTRKNTNGKISDRRK
jgi:hypothetical protein